jgi:hypothetical protein
MGAGSPDAASPTWRWPVERPRWGMQVARRSACTVLVCRREGDTMSIHETTAIDLVDLTLVVGGRRTPDGDSRIPEQAPPFKIPTPSVASPRTRCPNPRLWQRQENVAVTTSGMPVLVPTVHCPKYKPGF